MNRKRKLSNQLGKKIKNPGAHMPHAAVGILRKMRKAKQDLKEQLLNKRVTDPRKISNPYPEEFYTT